MKFELGRVTKTKPHLLADTFELVCALEGNPVSQTSGYSLIRNSIRSGEESLDIDEQDLDGDGEADQLNGTEINSRDQGYVDEAFRVIEYRSRTFGEFYPFDLIGDHIRLKRKLTERHALYLLLLSCSRLRSFKESDAKARLPEIFELLCKDVLRQMMPSKAKVICFGPTSRDRKRRFDTDLRLAMPLLTKFMGMKPSPDWDPKKVSSSGDGKIDLVGVHQFSDPEGGWNVLIGQCAAHENDRTWEKKRLEALYDSHVSKFVSPVRSQGVLFVPVSYRQADGRFVNSDYVTSVIFMDRERIVELYDPSLPYYRAVSRYVA